MLESSRVPKPKPRSAQPRGTARRPRPAPARARPWRETLLLVDDERFMREFLSRCLAKEGYRVLVAEDGEAALAMSERFREDIDLLVTDVMMPGMNGKDLADRLCVLRPDIKVLFVSGYSRADLWPDVCEDQTDWLPKPFTAAQLRRKVRQVLDGINES